MATTPRRRPEAAQVRELKARGVGASAIAKRLKIGRASVYRILEACSRTATLPRPGLRAADLHEGRDLKPAIDLRAVLKGVLRDHLRVDEVALATSVFPGSDDAKPMAGLLA